MPDPTPPVLSLAERLTAAEERITALENKPSPLTTWATTARGKLVRALPMIQQAAPWVIIAILLANQYGGCVRPGPTPDPEPTPAPVPAEGLHVMFVIEKDKLSSYPKGQLEAMQAQSVRLYLDSHAAKGKDGTTPEVRTYEPTSDVTQEAKLWQDAFARPRKSMPWVWIVKGNRGFEGAVPDSPEAMLALLQKYGGP